jgi:hypothetical protein
LGAAALLFGLIGGWFLFHPHVSLHPDQRLDPNDPFLTQFTIVNEGKFDVRDLNSACTFGDVETTHNVGMSGITRPSPKTISLMDWLWAAGMAVGGRGVESGPWMKTIGRAQAKTLSEFFRPNIPWTILPVLGSRSPIHCGPYPSISVWTPERVRRHRSLSLQ